MNLVPYLPAATSYTLICTLVLCYCICVYNGHCPAFLPSISQTGKQQLESSIFAFGLTTAALLVPGLALTGINHWYVSEICDRFHIDVRVPQRLCFVFQFGIPTGLILVANFPEAKPTIVVHFIGALLAFGSAITYMCCHMMISHKLYPVSGATYLDIFIRTLISFLVLLCVFGAGAFLMIGCKPGFAVCEWLIWVGLAVQLKSCSSEFKRIRLCLNRRLEKCLFSLKICTDAERITRN